MGPEELTHQLAEIDAQKREVRVPNLLRGIFSVFLGGVGGEFGCVLGLYLMASWLPVINVIALGLMVGPVLGFLPGLTIGLFCTRALRGRKVYVGFFFGVLIGIGLSPFAPVVLSFVGLFIPAPRRALGCFPETFSN